MDIKEIPQVSQANRHPWELARAEIIADFIRKNTRGVNPSKVSLIDIGCGDLFVLEKISKSFPFDEYYGVDTALKESDITSLESKFNQKLKLLNDLKDLKVKAGNTPIVLLNDVIEHIDDDEKFIIELKQHPFISEHSLFIITVPALQMLFCTHDVFLGHYRRYSSKQLVSLFNKAGFITISTGYFFFSLLLPRAFNKILEIFIRPSEKAAQGTGLTFWKGGKLVTALTKNILLLDYKFVSALSKIGINIPGLSTYAICKVSA